MGEGRSSSVAIGISPAEHEYTSAVIGGECPVYKYTRNNSGQSSMQLSSLGFSMQQLPHGCRKILQEQAMKAMKRRNLNKVKYYSAVQLSNGSKV